MLSQLVSQLGIPAEAQRQNVGRGGEVRIRRGRSRE